MTITRQENGVFLLVPFLAGGFWREWIPCRDSLRGSLGKIGLFTVGILIGIAPYLYQLRVTFGSPVSAPFHGSYLRYTDPKILSILFSPYHGLFYWSPILLLSVAGLVWGAKRFPEIRRLNLVLVFCFLIQLYVFSIVDSWWGGLSFGGRRFVNLVPVFIFGLAQLYHSIGNPRIMWGLFGVTFLWHLTLFFPFTFSLVPREAPVTLSYLLNAQMKSFTQLPDFYQGIKELSLVYHAWTDPVVVPFVVGSVFASFLLARFVWGLLARSEMSMRG
jgi:hypothetical protein